MSAADIFRRTQAIRNGSPITPEDIETEAWHKVYYSTRHGETTMRDNMHALLVSLRAGESDFRTVADAWSSGTSHPIPSEVGFLPDLAEAIERLLRRMADAAAGRT